ncbi:VWA domain-containing protein [Niabella terrae]
MKILKLIIGLMLPVLLLASGLVTVTISGKVLDENRQPVVNAVVQEKGSNQSASTDAQGNFSLEVSGKNAILIVTATGYPQQEIKVGTQRQLQIVLTPAGALLDSERKKLPTPPPPRRPVAPDSRRQEVALSPRTTDAGKGLVAVHRPTAFLYDLGRVKSPEHGRSVDPDFNREGYDHITENPFRKATDHPLSTFSIDVDGASYSNIRRFLMQGQLPPAGAVRIEEMINYFSYNYPQPGAGQPFGVYTEYVTCPWNNQHQLVSIALQGRRIPTANLPAANLVFLIDVSGSMASANKLPLVQASMKLLTDQLRAKDKVAIVVYAGKSAVVLPATSGEASSRIKAAIDQLRAGGSTAGGAGIRMAYQIASENFQKNGNNRVVLCTDGDFNVGQTSDDELERLIELKRQSGIYLTVLGFGTGNYQDAKMQKLADKGNGNHAYIDNLSEARKVLISQFGGTLFTIAKDVKLQVEFNPARVQGYRLIGYENRILAKEDFNDDKKDAGELGSGHTVTALYEVIPTGIPAPELKNTDALKYQQERNTTPPSVSGELLTVKLRYKKPEGDKSYLLKQPLGGKPAGIQKASENIRLAAAVAQFGMLLRQSAYMGNSSYQDAITLLQTLKKDEPQGYRSELLQLVQKANSLGVREDAEDQAREQSQREHWILTSR